MSKVGDRIIKAMDEVLDWTRGKGRMRIHLPGQKPRDMTLDEFQRERAKLRKDEAREGEER